MHLSYDGLSQWLLQYGNFAFFALLALGIIGLPIPEETMMIFAGYLIAEGKWPLIPTFLAALGGSICGITVSYYLGLTAGNFLLEKYGHYLGITEKKINYAHEWFIRIGKWSLFFGYFILGVRHLTGYIAGTTLLPYKKFALFAYFGALCWTTTFLSLGYFFKDDIKYVFQKMEFDLLFIIIICAAVAIYLIRLIFWRK
jgi:membrane protein DedA with SNARE-associated domain